MFGESVEEEEKIWKKIIKIISVFSSQQTVASNKVGKSTMKHVAERKNFCSQTPLRYCNWRSDKKSWIDKACWANRSSFFNFFLFVGIFNLWILLISAPSRWVLKFFNQTFIFSSCLNEKKFNLVRKLISKTPPPPSISTLKSHHEYHREKNNNFLFLREGVWVYENCFSSHSAFVKWQRRNKEECWGGAHTHTNC